jgi:polysaccharide biosynthesis/export protein
MKNLLCLCLLVPLAVAAQTPPQNIPAPSLPAANLPALEIGPNDLLQVTVYESPELSGTFRVSQAGTIRLPMVDQEIAASGLYPRDLEVKIKAALVNEHLVVNPVVTITVAEYQSRTVSVVGEVHHPLTFQAVGRVTLLDAIARAEGISEAAGDEVLVSEGQVGDGRTHSQAVVRRIPLKELMSARSPELNLTLRGGEEIRIPGQGHVSVVGNVRKPGSFAINRDQPPTVLNALAESEGLTPFANDRVYIYRSVDSVQAKQEIPVDLKKILDRKAPDLPLQAGDLLYIPDNHNRRMTLGTLDKLLTAGSLTGSAAIYAAR